jgi:AcrR family transcriptional regulator
MAPTTTLPRKTAEERREAILEASLIEFAERGFYGTSTDDIARRAGISQPYLFRLFGTKKELFIAACARCWKLTGDAFAAAAEGMRGEEALRAMGAAYMELLEEDPRRLRLQMHMYAACDDSDVRDATRKGFGELHALVERVSGADEARISIFFAKGMLLNVLGSMDVRNSELDWAQSLLRGCRDDN